MNIRKRKKRIKKKIENGALLNKNEILFVRKYGPLSYLFGNQLNCNYCISISMRDIKTLFHEFTETMNAELSKFIMEGEINEEPKGMCL